MPPAWIPICHCMQRYCEPYFAAVERWRSNASRHILANRIHMIETIDKLFHEYGQKKEIYEFDLVCEYPDNGMLLPEFSPSQGKEYVYGGDGAAFAAARSLVPSQIFNKVGLFYQNHLLKQLAGFCDQYLETANPETRKSLIALTEKLFRVPNEAGKVRIVYRVAFGDDGNEFGKYRNLHIDDLTEPTKQFLESLLQFTALENPAKKRKIEENEAENRRKRPKSSFGRYLGGLNVGKGGKAMRSGTGAVGKETKRKENKSSKETEDVDPVDNWQIDHSSVGTKVAAYFEIGVKGQRKLFSGEVVKYAPPSSSRAKDQLYHIIWEDGDEEDYDQKQLDHSIQLYEDQTGWVEEGHESIGKNVAAYFSLDIEEEKKKDGKKNKKPSQQMMSLFVGKVVKYSPSSKPENGDQLYHIVWQDGDEEDYSEEEYQAGRQLYEEEEERKKGDGITVGEDEVNHQGQDGEDNVEEENENVKSQDSEDAMVEEEITRKGKEKKTKETHVKEEIKSESNGISSSLFAMVEGIVDLLPEGMKEVKQALKGTFSNSEDNKDIKDITPVKSRTTRNQTDSISPGNSSSTKRVPKSLNSSTKSTGKTSIKKVGKEKKTKKNHSKEEKKMGTQGRDNEEDEEEEDSEMEPEVTVASDDNEDWTKDHSSIGVKVASYFPVGKGRKLFSGIITRYAPETKTGASDQLYHIVWDDGDEEDYSEDEYQAAIEKTEETTAAEDESLCF
jgi:hypothetical protein